MMKRLILALFSASLPLLALADARIPDTPAGRAFAAWLDQINDADHQQAFLASYLVWFKAEDIEKWRADVGGYDLLEIYSSEPNNIFFRVKRRKRPAEEIGRLEVDAKTPTKLVSLGAWRIAAGAKVEPGKMTVATRALVIERTAVLLERLHEDAVIGKQLATALRKKAKHGDYARIAYGDALATQVTGDLREWGHDKHLQLLFSYAVKTPESDALQAAADSRFARAENCGFEKAEHLRPNVGYLKVNFFPDAETCAATASAAMNFLADSDALILDLRDNNGGRVDQANFLMSYFFAGRVHTDDTYRRADNVTTEGWTVPAVPGKRFIDNPVFVLISNHTFSAGEAVAFILQDQKRATLVGETTVGGSGTIEFMSLDDHFTVVVPTGHVSSPITKTQWAGTGVVPDVKVPAADAMETALKLASAPDR